MFVYHVTCKPRYYKRIKLGDPAIKVLIGAPVLSPSHMLPLVGNTSRCADMLHRCHHQDPSNGVEPALATGLLFRNVDYLAGRCPGALGSSRHL